MAGDMLALGPDGHVARTHLGRVLSALRPRAHGGMVVALERQFALAGADGSVDGLGDLWADQAVRMNDGGCDPDGRFYCGSMAYDSAAGRGCLYRLDPDGSARVVLDGVTVSNGLAWSPDGATAYYVDSQTYRVDAFDYAREPGLSGRRPLVRLDPSAGIPDGLTVDADGYLWVALHGGGAVHRYAPDGKLDGRVEVPVSQVTACTFGGADLDRLYITTSRLGAGQAAEPAAGAVFRADVAVTGLPAATFAG